jgi:exodeoxyribonuclease VII small subunit
MDEKINKMTYEEKEKRLDDILKRLDSFETPIDQLASEAKEASALITTMYTTLKAAKQELSTVFEELEKQKNEM